jgi:hypothetical protein
VPTGRSLRLHNSREQVIPLSSVPLPKQWHNHAKTAFLCAVALAHQAMVWSVSWCVNSHIERVRLIDENEQLKVKVAILKEELRIKNARLAVVPPIRQKRGRRQAFRKVSSGPSSASFLSLAHFSGALTIFCSSRWNA